MDDELRTLRARVKQLEKENRAMERELRTFDDIFSKLRSCDDPRCHLCATCVNGIFVTTVRPAPVRIPAKYHGQKWRT